VCIYVNVCLCGRIDGRVVEIGAKARAKIGDSVDIPGVQCDLGLHTHHLISSIEGGVLEELGLRDQPGVTDPN